MSIKYLWIYFFFPSILTLIYFLINNYLKKLTVRNKLKYLIDKNENISNIFLTSPLTEKIKNKLLRITPENMRKKLVNKITFSGVNWDIKDLLLLKTLVAVFIMFGSYLIINGFNFYIFKIIFILILGLFGFFIPDVFLIQKAKSRRKKIELSLAPFIEYLLITVEAGLGLDIAILRVIKQIRGPLAEEIANTMTEIKYGKSKQVAFKNLAYRINLPEFTTFITVLINGEKTGVSISNILRVQGQQIREKRRQRIEEMAYKAPIKMLFPIILFILPGLFIVILGPAAIQLLEFIVK